jgi:hypothetical protein
MSASRPGARVGLHYREWPRMGTGNARDWREPGPLRLAPYPAGLVGGLSEPDDEPEPDLAAAACFSTKPTAMIAPS